MTRVHQPDAFTASPHPYFAAETVTYYHGTCNIYGPHGAHPGWTYEHHLSCEHKHTDPQAAIECGARMGRREAAIRSELATDAYRATRCDVRPLEYDVGMREPKQWIMACHGHYVKASRLYPTEAGCAEAEAGWACPWAPFVEVS